MGRRVLFLAVALLMATSPARSEIFKSGKFTIYGDFRLRAETDWDSQDSAGTGRDDRTRMRVRVRTGFTFDPTEQVRFEARIRGGADGSQQSPHITILDFQDNDTGDASLEYDRWYIRGRRGGLEAWAGRKDLPFWKQDELLFDDDVTMPGVAVSWRNGGGKGSLALAAGYYTPPVGMTLYSGSLAAGQVAWQPTAGGISWSFAGGAYLFDGNPDDPDIGGLLQGNGARDYTIISASAQARFHPGSRPFVIGADVMTNTRDYDPNDPDPITAANSEETNGYVLVASWGSLKKSHDWLVGYYFARIETLAVNNSFSQDDWVRWGDATQTRGSNMKGHEFRFAWAFDSSMNLVARLYLVDAITSVEDGNRFRVDLNYRF